MIYPVVPKVALAKNPTVNELQAYVKEMTTARGQDKHDLQADFELLCERIGEMARAVRIYEEVKAATNTPLVDIHGEIANLFWALIVLANEVDISMTKAVQVLEKTNRHRVWF